LERQLRTEPVKAFVESHFHVVTIDVGMFMVETKKKNGDIPRKYGLDLNVSGVPAIVVLNANGRILATTRDDGEWRGARRHTTNELMPFLEDWARKQR
jgi:hypothetical protein